MKELVPPRTHLREFRLNRIRVIGRICEKKHTETARLAPFRVGGKVGFFTPSSSAGSSGYRSGKMEMDGGGGRGSEGMRSCVVVLITAVTTRPRLFRVLLVVLTLTVDSRGALMVMSLDLAVAALGIVGGGGDDQRIFGAASLL